VALERAVGFPIGSTSDLLGAGVFGDGLGSLGNGVFREFSRQKETDGGLDFPTGDRRSLVVVGESGRFGGDPFEDVVHERVHDGHGLRADSGVGVNLLEDLVDVAGVGLLPLPFALLVSSASCFLGLGGLFGSLGRRFGRHSSTIFENFGKICREKSCKEHLLRKTIYFVRGNKIGKNFSSVTLV